MPVWTDVAAHLSAHHARAEIEVGSESSTTDSHEATSADTGGIGVDYETDGFAVTYSADVYCDLTLGYVEEDLLYDDQDSKAKDGLPCGRATFTFDEPG